MHKELIAMYYEELGYDPPSWPKEANGAKKILKAGFTPSDAIECYRHYKGTKFWKDKHLSLTYIAANIAAWSETRPPKMPEADDLDRWFKENNSGLESW